MYKKCGGSVLEYYTTLHNTHASLPGFGIIITILVHRSQELRIILVNSPRHEKNPFLAFPQKLSFVIRPDEIAMLIKESETRLTPQFYKLPCFIYLLCMRFSTRRQ
jgi:hypothetical protein